VVVVRIGGSRGVLIDNGRAVVEVRNKDDEGEGDTALGVKGSKGFSSTPKSIPDGERATEVEAEPPKAWLCRVSKFNVGLIVVGPGLTITTGEEGLSFEEEITPRSGGRRLPSSIIDRKPLPSSGLALPDDDAGVGTERTLFAVRPSIPTCWLSHIIIPGSEAPPSSPSTGNLHQDPAPPFLGVVGVSIPYSSPPAPLAPNTSKEGVSGSGMSRARLKIRLWSAVGEGIITDGAWAAGTTTVGWSFFRLLSDGGGGGGFRLVGDVGGLVEAGD
jgi:hypothetical protein